MSFETLQLSFPVLFAGFVLFSWKKVWKRRNSAANVWMLPFAQFSLSAWVLWVLQYAILVVGPFGFLPSDLYRTAFLSLTAMQNALWITAILSLYLRHFSRVSLILSFLGMLSILVAVVVYLTPILTLGPAVQILDAVTTVSIFLVLAASIWQLRVSKVYAAYFFLHGYFQWIWKYLWFLPSSKNQVMVLVLFPFWHIFLFFSWSKLISEMLGRFRVMISSTIKDLGEERKAAERAIRSLHLEGLRSETIGSRAYTPKALCQLWAEQCNLFILIIGERYGHIIKSKRKSVVEFEYDVASEADSGKILVYVKEGVNREPELEEFLKRVDEFETGRVRKAFYTPEDLSERIQNDVKGWLAEHRKPEDGTDDWS